MVLDPITPKTIPRTMNMKRMPFQVSHGRIIDFEPFACNLAVNLYQM